MVTFEAEIAAAAEVGTGAGMTERAEGGGQGVAQCPGGQRQEVPVASTAKSCLKLHGSVS